MSSRVCINDDDGDDGGPMTIMMTMTMFSGELRYDCRSHKGVQPNIGARYQVKWDDADADHNYDDYIFVNFKITFLSTAKHIF